MHEQVAELNEFDGPCALAASLLDNESIQQWVASAFPLVVVDEAQDLDDHRMRILQMLSRSCRIVAAADAFQCLVDGRDTADLVDWLEKAGQTHRLTHPRRTLQQGLLAAALAVREGRDVTTVLTRSPRAQRRSWNARGFRLVETFATNAGIVARTIADEISYRTGPVAILSPDMTSELIRGALRGVHTRVWRRGDQDFGPFPITQEQSQVDEANALLAGIALPEVASHADLSALLAPHSMHASIADAIRRIDRLRRVTGQLEFTAAQVTELIHDSVRNWSRQGFRPHRGRLAMTIQRAKNREFPNVIVLWPYSAVGSPQHLRRLLYNGITRAQQHCTVVVLGQNRLNSAPFS